ncbi:MAG: PAS domain S-box protein [Spirochaetes bacterium]|jgi:PAS domain S-box-containing protein|nr:PAS domain S-box protein [Spirochaetota bacterium]
MPDTAPDTAHDEQYKESPSGEDAAAGPDAENEHLPGLAESARAISPDSNRLWHILGATPVGICITDRHGYFEYVNPVYSRLYGYRPEALLGSHFTVVVPEDSQKQLSELHDAFIAAGGGSGELRGEWSVRGSDGTPKVILADAAFIEDTRGEPKKVTFVADITERKRMEQELQDTISELHSEIHERRRLEATKQEVERMMRHDLRNPLNGMLTAAELLLRDELTEGQRELVLAIRDSGRRLDTMISSSMDYVRMEEGGYELDPQPLNMLDLFRAVESQLASILSGSSVTLTYDVDRGEIDWNGSLPLYGEVIYLEELFANLVRNAVEASHPGDAVSISIMTDASEARTGTYLVRIHNSRPVPADVRGRFFERYATSGKKGGSGLGTYISRLVATAHNGRIWFHTAEEHGTDVFVELPLLPVSKEEA